jgi:hypothetical protein
MSDPRFAAVKPLPAEQAQALTELGCAFDAVLARLDASPVDYPALADELLGLAAALKATIGDEWASLFFDDWQPGQDRGAVELIREGIRALNCDDRPNESSLKWQLDRTSQAHTVPPVAVTRAHLAQIADGLLVALAAGRERPRQPGGVRLRIERDKVILDGEEVQFGTTPDNRARMLCYLRHLLEANGDWRSDPWIKKAEKGRSGGFSDVDR